MTSVPLVLMPTPLRQVTSMNSQNFPSILVQNPLHLSMILSLLRHPHTCSTDADRHIPSNSSNGNVTLWIATVGFGSSSFHLAILRGDLIFIKLFSFEYAVQPSRMLCCGKIFCREHIKDVRSLLPLPFVYGSLTRYFSGCMAHPQMATVLLVALLALYLISCPYLRPPSERKIHQHPRHKPQSLSIRTITSILLALAHNPCLQRQRNNHQTQQQQLHPWIPLFWDYHLPRRSLITMEKKRTMRTSLTG